MNVVQYYRKTLRTTKGKGAAFYKLYLYVFLHVYLKAFVQFYIVSKILLTSLVLLL